MKPYHEGGFTAGLPAPLVSRDVDLSGFPRFMLDVDRLLGSELLALATDEEFKAAILLWCRAWKQTPPASLPDDDRILAAFSGTGRRWPKVRAMALRGFVKCSDGRLYHPVLAADVESSWEKRKRFRERSVKAHAKRWGVNADQPVDIAQKSGATSIAQAVTKQSLLHAIDRDRDRDSKKENRLLATADAMAASDGFLPIDDQAVKPPADPPTPPPEPSEGYTAEFETWWSLFPKYEGKGAAFKAFKLAKKRTTVDKMTAGVKAYANARAGADPRYTKRAASWLNEDCWNDEPPPKLPGGHKPGHGMAANGG